MFTKFLHGQSELDTIAVDGTYNMLLQNKRLIHNTDLPLNKSYLIRICNLLKKFLLKEPTVLHLEPHVHILGDLQGQYNYLWHFTKTPETTDKFLFLGDYCNKGRHSLEVLALAFTMKLLQPNQVFLLRGSCETPEICEKYGFKAECLRRFDQEVYDKFLEVFECLPLAAVITNSAMLDKYDEHEKKTIICMNGGISSDFHYISQLEAIQRPYKVPASGLVHGILFANPVKESKSKDNSKGSSSKGFTSQATHDFLKHNKLDYMIRAHQFEEDGYEYPYGEKDHSIITIYSAPNNGKAQNAGAHIFLREDMLYHVTQVEPSVTTF